MLLAVVYNVASNCGGAAHQGVTFPAKAKHGGRSVLNERVNAWMKHHIFLPFSFAFSHPHVNAAVI